jgi:hypothetical protein
MSASPVLRPLRPRAPARVIRRAPPATPSRTLDLVGRDLARPERPALRSARRLGGGLLAACVVAALGLSALRVQILRLRYQVARAVAAEQTLLEEKRELTVRVRELRDPLRLAARAGALGFARPQRLIELPAARPPVGPPIAP